MRNRLLPLAILFAVTGGTTSKGSSRSALTSRFGLPIPSGAASITRPSSRSKVSAARRSRSGWGGVGHEFGDPWGAEAVRVGPRAAWLQDDAVRRSWRAEAGHRPFTRTDTRDATAPKAPTTSVCTRLEAAEAEIVRDADGTAGLLVKRFDRVPKAEGGTAMRAQERLSG